MLPHPTQPDRAAPPSPPAPDRATKIRIAALAADLRYRYASAYYSAIRAIPATRWEQPDSDFDPVYAADTEACTILRYQLAATIANHLPGTTLSHWAAPAEPAVIESTWLHPSGTVEIYWDASYDFGAPDGLTVKAVDR